MQTYRLFYDRVDLVPPDHRGQHRFCCAPRASAEFVPEHFIGEDPAHTAGKFRQVAWGKQEPIFFVAHKLRNSVYPEANTGLPAAKAWHTIIGRLSYHSEGTTTNAALSINSVKRSRKLGPQIRLCPQARRDASALSYVFTVPGNHYSAALQLETRLEQREDAFRPDKPSHEQSVVAIGETRQSG